MNSTDKSKENFENMQTNIFNKDNNILLNSLNGPDVNLYNEHDFDMYYYSVEIYNLIFLMKKHFLYST